MTTEAILIIIGATIFSLLGGVHLFYTFFTNKFEAYDSDITETMKTNSIILTKETTIWNAWIGFNASHSFGALLLGLFYIPLVFNHWAVVTDTVWFSFLPCLVGISYLVLAKRYWFKTPLIGISIATFCFIVSFIRLHVIS